MTDNTFSSPTHRPLNQKQKHFLDRYHITGNLGQSWLDAGYHCSIESASSNAGRILQREDAQAYLRELQQHDREKSGCTREMIIDRFKQILFSESARDRDVILAGREIARMIGAYHQPKPEPVNEPVDTLKQFIQRVRAGEAHEHHSPPETAQITDSSQAEADGPEEFPLPESTGEIQKLAQLNIAPSAPPYGQKTTTERDPDWHPLYNPYYDPTIQKPKRVKVITPRTR